MLWLGFLAVLGMQDPSPTRSAPDRLYERPVVRPYEPPSDFGRERAQGDRDDAIFRKSLTAPVTVDAYHHSYEVTRSDSDVAYDQGVTQAEQDSDSLMGPLDGLWVLHDATGRTLAHLLLVDPGEAWAIEGAWMQPGSSRTASQLEPLAAVGRGPDGAVSVPLGELGLLTLRPSEKGEWVSTLRRGGAVASVSLVPAA